MNAKADCESRANELLNVNGLTARGMPRCFFLLVKGKMREISLCALRLFSLSFFCTPTEMMLIDNAARCYSWMLDGWMDEDGQKEKTWLRRRDETQLTRKRERNMSGAVCFRFIFVFCNSTRSKSGGGGIQRVSERASAFNCKNRAAKILTYSPLRAARDD